MHINLWQIYVICTDYLYFVSDCQRVLGPSITHQLQVPASPGSCCVCRNVSSHMGLHPLLVQTARILKVSCIGGPLWIRYIWDISQLNFKGFPSSASYRVIFVTSQRLTNQYWEVRLWWVRVNRCKEVYCNARNACYTNQRKLAVGNGETLFMYTLIHFFFMQKCMKWR